MTSIRKNAAITLGVQRIEPVNLEDPLVQAALEQTRRSLANSRLQKILEVRTTIQHFLCDELIHAGYVHPPIYMLAGCTDPLNHWTYPARINYYGEEISVTQSLILHKILMVMLSSVGRVFFVSPNIRMEMRIARKEYKYSTEFMQVDFEKRGGTYEEMLQFISGLVQRLFKHLNDQHGEVIEEIRGEPLPEIDERMPIYDAEDVKREQGLADDDAVERWLSKQSAGKPFMLVNLVREAYDCYDPTSGRYLNYDVILPPYGDNPHPVECLSGAERTRSLADLEQRMLNLGYPMEYFAPFFELFSSMDRGSGAISCAGAGFGIERLTYAVLGLKDVHEVYPFPRMAESKIAV
ncbi:MAG: amino acid--tRNA ligase-related protein [Candidatus Zixiibacteriota bacterium]